MNRYRLLLSGPLFVAVSFFILVACSTEPGVPKILDQETPEPQNQDDPSIIHVSSVMISPSSLTLDYGQQAKLVATITPSNATNQEVVWASSNPSVVSYNQEGYIAAIGEGSSVVSASADGKTGYCSVTVTMPNITVDYVALKDTSVMLLINETFKLQAIAVTSTSTYYPLSWSSSNTSIASVKDGEITALKEGSATITAEAKGAKAFCHLVVRKKPSGPVPSNGVDLGLSVFWASYNVGSSTPEGFGDYFAWGETYPYYQEGHSQDDPCSSWRPGVTVWGYDWLTYKWCDHVWLNEKLTKYNTDSSRGSVDNKTELERGENPGESVDDAARALWGRKWRTPTDKEFDELLDFCDQEWISRNGVTGILFKSKKKGYENKSVFFPSAGYRGGTHYSEVSVYWSSTLDLDLNCNTAWSLELSHHENVGYSYLSPMTRCHGLPVRPVTE